MSIIPSTAIAAALSPIQRADADSTRAYTLQSLKNAHHTNDVEELDDTAVNSVSDESHGNGHDTRKQKKHSPHPDLQSELIDIDALKDAPPALPVAPDPAPPHLDISA